MIDAGDTALLIGAIATALATVGGGIKFIWNKVEKRFQAIEKQVLECRQREAISAAADAVKLTVIELLWHEVRTHNPGSHVLARAKQLLDALKLDRVFPVEGLPPEFSDMAARLDGDD